MSVLLDLVPETKAVRVGDKDIPVRGLSINEVVRGLSRFPEVMKLYDRRTVDTGKLVMEAPAVCAAAIAAGVGKFGDEAEEAAASRLPIEIQLDLLEAIFALTFRTGFGPFADRMRRLLGGSTTTPPTNSHKPSPTSQPEAIAAPTS